MPDTTPRLQLPLLQSGQAQKELFHNEAICLLDLLVQAAVETAGDDAPPASPQPGQGWIVGATPTGDWAGQANALAGWTTGGWRFVPPVDGMRLWVRSAGLWAQWSAGAWTLGHESGASFSIGGVQVVGPQQPAIADPAGGTTVDAAARATLAAILGALREHGLVAR